MKTDRRPLEISELRCTLCGANLDAVHLEVGLEGTVGCMFCGAPQPLPRPAPSDDATNGFPSTFGRWSLTLQGARQRRGESLDDVRAATGIRESTLADLESGHATFEPYPEHVYGRYFLREYAAHLELDPKPLVDAFDADHERERLPFHQARPIPLSRRRSTSRLVIAVAASIVIAAGVMTQREQGGSDDDVISASGVLTAPISARGSTMAGGSGRQPQADPLQGYASRRPTERIKALATIDAASWIEVVSDGTTIYRAIAPAGAQLRFAADRTLLITLGNAGGVNLRINGRPRPTGDAGEVVHLRFERGSDGRS
jgi:cytoskeleton protein RodZ